MYSIPILVTLAMPSLIVNNLALRTVFWPAKALEDDTCYSGLQRHTAGTACMFLGDIALISVIKIRVEEEKKALRYRWSRNSR